MKNINEWSNNDVNLVEEEILWTLYNSISEQ